jgi:NADH-quinone oxidoreductase subunit J
MPLPLLAEGADPSALIGLASIVLPVALGLAAVYLLLPRPRPFPAWTGAACGALALLAAGLLLIRAEVFDAETVLFYSFAGLAVLSGALLVTQRNPVRAALSFALVVLSTCGLFLLQAAPFLMAATVIVYAGAIVVTFLFVIMLAQQAGLSDADARSREPGLSAVASFILLGTLLYLLGGTFEKGSELPRPFTRATGALAANAGPAPQSPPMPAENVAALGHDLFTTYLIPVELGGTLLLVATIGAIAIAGRRTEGLR